MRIPAHLIGPPAFSIALLLGACTYLTPYKMEIQQGNVVAKDELAQLRLGMTKQHVARVLGTPLLSDAFHADRWDYIHYVRKRGRMTDQRKLTVVFQQDRLVRLEGEGVPVLAPSDAAAPRTQTLSGPEASAAQGATSAKKR